jgi:hypothetical protein
VAVVRTDVTEERSASIIRVTKIVIFFRSMRLLLVTANVPSSPILVTLVMEVLPSSETSVLTRTTGRNIPEDGIFIIAAVKISNLTKLTEILKIWHGPGRSVPCYHKVLTR